MKATLTFNLPEEQYEYDAANKGAKALYVITEMDQHLRSILKYEEGHSDATYEMVQSIRDFLREKCLEEGINL